MRLLFRIRFKKPSHDYVQLSVHCDNEDDDYNSNDHRDGDHDHDDHIDDDDNDSSVCNLQCCYVCSYIATFEYPVVDNTSYISRMC